MAKKLEPLEPTTIEELTERYPSLVAEIRTQTRQEGLEAGKEAGTKEGRTAGYQDGLTTGAERERTRIKAVRAQHLAGHEKLIEACMFDGSTTGEQAAAKVLEAERTKRGQTLEALYAEAPKPVPASEGSDAPSPSGGNEASWKAEWERNIGGVQQEFTSEAAFLAFQRADARGGIKILTKRVAERTAAPVV